jgi:maltooligosyltrehalose trehalohydrolase
MANSTSAAGVPALGTWFEAGKVHVRAWAPDHRDLACVTFGQDGQTVQAEHPMRPEPGGMFHLSLDADPASFLYKLRVDGEGPFPDPWSRAQPFGVHGPSGLDTARFEWTDAGWKGIPLEEWVIEEVHVGTASPDGTFQGLIPLLPRLRARGITALELLPLASFPGRWNWGYDGVSWNAPAQVYGGPEGLRALIDAAHRAGIAVVIDAVYNHLGPDGNYLQAYAKGYFTSRHHTPWGDAINYDGEGSEVVRELALRNAEMWIRDYHADGLRLDAVHAIEDNSEVHLLQAIAQRARAAGSGRHVVITAEDNRNDARLVTPVAQGGYGLDAVWADDLHHELRRAFAGDSQGYYGAYAGTVEELVETLNEGWFFRGQRPGKDGNPRGTPGASLPPRAFIVCIQNHDQVGNRPFGNRLSEDVSDAAFRAMSAILLLSPYTPMLFAGQAWNTRTPFLYFTDHHAELGRLVTEGRRKEFEDFAQFQHAEVPDPQAEETFRRSKLDWSEAERAPYAGILALYRALLALRHAHPALLDCSRGSFEARGLGENALVLERRGGGQRISVLLNVKGRCTLPWEKGTVVLDTEDAHFGGSGALASVREAVIEGPRGVVVSHG